MDDGFSVVIGVADSVLLYASDEDDSDFSELSSSVSFAVLDS
jgi:hypothetical protein